MKTDLAPFFSIVIPVYNATQYIPNLIESLFEKQSLSTEKYEVIAVNDGSKDDSLRLLLDYAKIYPNLIVLDKSNGGAPSARNAGVKVARGKYMTFVDSDDMIGDDALQMVYDWYHTYRANVLDIDMIITHVIRNIHGNISRHQWVKALENKIISGKELFKSYNFTRAITTGTFFRKGFWQENEFYLHEDMKIGDDTLMFMQCMALANNVSFCNVDFYYILPAPGSLTTDFLKAAECYAKLVPLADDFAKKHQLDKGSFAIVNFYRDSFIWNFLHRADLLNLSIDEIDRIGKPIIPYLPRQFAFLSSKIQFGIQIEKYKLALWVKNHKKIKTFIKRLYIKSL